MLVWNGVKLIELLTVEILIFIVCLDFKEYTRPRAELKKFVL